METCELYRDIISYEPSVHPCIRPRETFWTAGARMCRCLATMYSKEVKVSLHIWGCIDLAHPTHYCFYICGMRGRLRNPSRSHVPPSAWNQLKNLSWLLEDRPRATWCGSWCSLLRLRLRLLPLAWCIPLFSGSSALIPFPIESPPLGFFFPRWSSCPAFSKKFLASISYVINQVLPNLSGSN